MAKPKIIFACQNCGYQSPRWLGKCPDCNQWNSLVEETTEVSKNTRIEVAGTRQDPSRLSEISTREEGRVLSGIGEFDRVLGGGLVRGSVILIGGDPGIGKSTLLLEVSDKLSASCGKNE